MPIINEHPDRDAPASVETPYAISVGDRFRGTLAERTDTDWLRIDLDAGQTYTLTLHGIGPGPVADTVLTVHDAAGTQVARNDDADAGARQLYSQLTFTPATSGTYYLSAAAYTGNPGFSANGRYELRVYDEDGASARTLTGTDRNDAFLAGGPGDDTLDGDAGDDVLVGGPGADLLRGGPGQDTAWYGYSGGGVTVRLDTGQASGGEAEGDTFGTRQLDQTDAEGNTRTVTVPDIEHLHGSAHADTLVGNALANTLRGDDGDDTLSGGRGNDWLSGGAGADTLIGGAGQDTASYRYSDAGVTVRLHSGQAHGGHAEGDTFAGADTYVTTDADGAPVTVPDIEHLRGSAHDDTLAGDGRDNVLDGGAGNDTLYGGPDGGADTLLGGPGDDTLYGGIDEDTLNGGDGNDTLDGGRDNDTLDGGTGNDALDGGRGADVLHGGPGDDALNGGAGDDTLAGGPGADALSGGAGDDTAAYRDSDAGVTVRLHDGAARGGHAEGDTFAGTGADTVADIEHLHGSDYNDVLAGDSRANVLRGAGGEDTLYGGPGGGDDTLAGGPGDDRLFGGRGDDTLRGGPGNDVLHGGGGNDTLTGGPGADTFVFAPGAGADTVADFQSEEDRIDLSAFGDLASIDDLDLQPGPEGLVIDVTGPDGGALTLTLTGVLPDQIADTDFIF